MREALSMDKLKAIYDGIARTYDTRHSFLTARTDQRGRKMLIENTVRDGDKVLDCGSGTGTTGIMAARRVGPGGWVTMFDLSETMLDVAREKAIQEGVEDRVTFQRGDMAHLPFDDDIFDVVLSTYSLCPMYDPAVGALELYRVSKRGGKIGIAHSIEPVNPVVKWLSDRVEGIAWRFPRLSMGCRSISVLPTLQSAGGRLILSRRFGIPLWPFLVFIVEKPTT